jgi:hypothetical protein
VCDEGQISIRISTAEIPARDRFVPVQHAELGYDVAEMEIDGAHRIFEWHALPTQRQRAARVSR